MQLHTRMLNARGCCSWSLIRLKGVRCGPHQCSVNGVRKERCDLFYVIVLKELLQLLQAMLDTLVALQPPLIPVCGAHYVMEKGQPLWLQLELRLDLGRALEDCLQLLRQELCVT